MDLLTVLSTCSLAKDFGLVLAMAMAFSRGEPLTVRAAADVDDVLLDDEALGDEDVEVTRSRERALAEMHRLRQPLVGLLPVPVSWAERYQHKPADLLNACAGVTVATAQLSEFERACSGRARGVRECALHAYVEAAGIPLFELAVLDSIQDQHLPTNNDVVVETDDVRGAGVFALDAPEHLSGAARVFVAVEPPTPEQKPSPSPPAPAPKNNSKTNNVQVNPGK